MSWKLDDTRIYVRKFSKGNNHIIARLQPLNSKTIHHVFGTESEIIDIDFIVIGNDDLDTLKSKVEDGNFHTFSGYYNIYYDDILVKSLKSELQQVMCQTVRPDLPETAPVYTCSMELYRDE